MKKHSAYKAKATTELNTLLAEKRTVLRAFRFSIAGSNARNVKEGKALKRDIARILTLLNKQSKVTT